MYTFHIISSFKVILLTTQILKLYCTGVDLIFSFKISDKSNRTFKYIVLFLYLKKHTCVKV